MYVRACKNIHFFFALSITSLNTKMTFVENENKKWCLSIFKLVKVTFARNLAKK